MTEATVIGDPEGMRALARELRGRADVLRANGRAPSSRLAATTFEGPAAERLRAAADDIGAQLSAVCSDLEATASAMTADAATVETQNAELRAKAEREAQEAADAAARAGQDTSPPAGPAEPAPADPVPEARS